MFLVPFFVVPSFFSVVIHISFSPLQLFVPVPTAFFSPFIIFSFIIPFFFFPSPFIFFASVILLFVRTAFSLIALYVTFVSILLPEVFFISQPNAFILPLFCSIPLFFASILQLFSFFTTSLLFVLLSFFTFIILVFIFLIQFVVQPAFALSFTQAFAFASTFLVTFAVSFLIYAFIVTLLPFAFRLQSPLSSSTFQFHVPFSSWPSLLEV